jgi:hypothetical protein
MCAQLSTDFSIYATRVNNGSPARKKDEYANADAEKWFLFRRMLDMREVILPVDGELLKQLSSRRLQYDSKARIQLESKESMRGRGLSSPDRADAGLRERGAGGCRARLLLRHRKRSQIDLVGGAGQKRQLWQLGSKLGGRSCAFGIDARC